MGQKKFEEARAKVQAELAASGSQTTIPNPDEHRGPFLDFMTTFRATHPVYARELEEAWLTEDEPSVPVARQVGKGSWLREKWTNLGRALFMRKALDGQTWVWDKSKSGTWTLVGVVGGGMALWALTLTPPPRAQQVSQAQTRPQRANVSGAYLPEKPEKKGAPDQDNSATAEATASEPARSLGEEVPKKKGGTTATAGDGKQGSGTTPPTGRAGSDSPFANKDGGRSQTGGPPPPPPGFTKIETDSGGASAPAASGDSPFTAEVTPSVPPRRASGPVVLTSRRSSAPTLTRSLPTTPEVPAPTVTRSVPVTSPSPFGGSSPFAAEVTPSVPSRRTSGPVVLTSRQSPAPTLTRSLHTTPAPDAPLAAFGGADEPVETPPAASTPAVPPVLPAPARQAAVSPFGGSEADDTSTLVYQDGGTATAPDAGSTGAASGALVFEPEPEREVRAVGRPAASSALLFETTDAPTRAAADAPSQASGLSFADVPTDPNAPNFDPTQQVQARLVTGINAPARGEVPVLAQSPEGTWIGTATVDVQLGRVNLEFIRLYRGGKYYDVQALAYQLQGGNLLQGVSAPIKAVAPQLGQQLVRQTINGLSTYAENLLSSGTTTVSGNFATTTRNVPNLLTTLAGEAARVFRVQGETQVFSAVAQLPSGATFVILNGLTGR